MKRKYKLGIIAIVFMLLCIPCISSYAADDYDGASKVKIKSGNVRPRKDTAIAYCCACQTGNRWNDSEVNSSAVGTGHVFLYDATEKKYKSIDISGKKSMNKTGTKYYFVKANGKKLLNGHKYDDAYTMSIYMRFDLTCNQCAAEVTRYRHVTEDPLK